MGFNSGFKGLSGRGGGGVGASLFIYFCGDETWHQFLDCAVSFAVPACPSGKGIQGQRGGKALGSLQADLSYILKLS